MAQHNGITEDSSGELIQSGFVSTADLAADTTYDSGTMTIRTDVPHPGKTQREAESGDPITRWTGTIWDEVIKP